MTAPPANFLEADRNRDDSAILGGNNFFWCNNDGSAADAQHPTADFVGRFRWKQRGMPSLALTPDSSVLASVGKDYSFDQIFSRRLEALCNPGISSCA
jgi:D-sedoheptulose 7-phosphate isomerase